MHIPYFQLSCLGDFAHLVLIELNDASLLLCVGWTDEISPPANDNKLKITSKWILGYNIHIHVRFAPDFVSNNLVFINLSARVTSGKSKANI